MSLGLGQAAFHGAKQAKIGADRSGKLHDESHADREVDRAGDPEPGPGNIACPDIDHSACADVLQGDDVQFKSGGGAGMRALFNGIALQRFDGGLKKFGGEFHLLRSSVQSQER